MPSVRRAATVSSMLIHSADGTYELRIHNAHPREQGRKTHHFRVLRGERTVATGHAYEHQDGDRRIRFNGESRPLPKDVTGALHQACGIPDEAHERRQRASAAEVAES